jgi:6-phosphogluconolactonase (cycloisomerase 2 family)
VMQTFSLGLGDGQVRQINNADGPPTPGIPTTVVLDPAGSFAYVLVTQSSAVANGVTGVASYPIGSDGKLGAVGSTTALQNATVTIKVNGLNVTESVPVSPVTMVIDSAGKFLFVADSATSDSSLNPVPGAVSVFAISNGSLAEVPTSPFVLPAQPGGANSSATALGVTATAYPPAFAPCSGQTASATEDLYVTDSPNNLILNYLVSSTGTLPIVPTSQNLTGTLPSGIAVDPCNRFVYVSNATSNNISAYTICNAVSLSNGCPNPDDSLLAVTGSPFGAGSGPGPLVVDPYGNFLYVLDRGQFAVSGFRLSSTSGALSPLNPATVATNSFPTSIAIRSDDTWVFVSNLNSANLSQYAVTPATGNLTPQPPVVTDNFPWGVAVK